MDSTYTMPLEFQQLKSSGYSLVKLGLILFCLSACLCVNAVTIGVISEEWSASIGNICCSCIFIVISFLAMYGENGETKHERRILTSCIIMTVIGVIAIIISTVVNMQAWQDFTDQCSSCDKSNKTNQTAQHELISTFRHQPEFGYDDIANRTDVTDIHEGPNMSNGTGSSLTNVTDIHEDPNTSNGTGSSLTNVTDLVRVTGKSGNSSQDHGNSEKCDWFCFHNRLCLFLIYVGLSVCNGLLSIGLAYVIFTNRLNLRNYVPAVLV